MNMFIEILLLTRLYFLGGLIKTIAPAVIGGFLSNKGAKDRNEANIAAARETQSFNAEQADINRKFQERMSNTAHQREIKDLNRAGLNPILSAKYGGSSTPTGSMATGVTPQIEDEISPGVSTAMQIRLNKAQVKKTEADAVKAEAEARKTDEETKTVPISRDKIRQEIANLKGDLRYKLGLTRKTVAEIVNIREQRLNIEADTTKKITETQSNLIGQQEMIARIQAIKSKVKLNDQQLREMITRFPGLVTEQEIDESKFGEISRYINRFNPFASSAKSIKSIMR